MKLALATLIALSPVNSIEAGEYQAGYSHSRTCFRSEYREEYVPGTEDNPGYIKSWKETVEYPCSRSRIESTPENTTRTRVYDEYEVDDNDCSEGSVAGALLGGGLAGFGSRGKDRWWAIPLGAVGGSMVGCQIDGG
tara:strand:+ start:792 stop:1202 length:411 start_codon:yes stop_codon:yes gene_type:complete